MIFVGIDPSFSETGVSVLDSIKFIAVSPPGKNDSYKIILNRSAYIVSSILENIQNYNTVIIIEEPLVNSMKASSLGILSGVIVTSLATLPFTSIYSAPTSYVSRLNRDIIKQYDINRKKASIRITQYILDYLSNKKEFSFTITSNTKTKSGLPKKRALSHDEAEAFLLLIPVLKLYRVLDDEDITEISKVSKKLGVYQKIELIKEQQKNGE